MLTHLHDLPRVLHNVTEPIQIHSLSLHDALPILSLRYISLCATAWGRGPTTLMRPCSTLMNCGSSSSEVRRRKAPSGVTRLSFFVACGTTSPSSATVMVRNL